MKANRFLLLLGMVILFSCGDDDDDDNNENVILTYTLSSPDDDNFFLIISDETGAIIDTANAKGQTQVQLTSDEALERFTLTTVIDTEFTFFVNTYHNINISLMTDEPGPGSSIGPGGTLTINVDETIRELSLSSPAYLYNIFELDQSNPFPRAFDVDLDQPLYGVRRDTDTPQYVLYSQFDDDGSITVDPDDFINMSFNPIDAPSDRGYSLIMFGYQNDLNDALFTLDAGFLNDLPLNSLTNRGLYYPGDFFNYYVTSISYTYLGFPATSTYLGPLPSTIEFPNVDDIEITRDINQYNFGASGTFNFVRSIWSAPASLEERSPAWNIISEGSISYPLNELITFVDGLAEDVDLDDLEYVQTGISNSGISYDESITRTLDSSQAPAAPVNESVGVTVR